MDDETAAILDRVEARAKLGKASPFTPEELRALTTFWGRPDISEHTVEVNRWLEGLDGR